MRPVAVLLALALAGIAAALIVSVGGSDMATAGTAASNGVCGAVHFDHYDAGAEVAGLKKAETRRECEEAGAPTRIDMLLTVYGSCEPVGRDGGCAPPVQVQSWPACERNRALYEKYPAPDGSTKQYEESSVRGVPAAIFDDGHRIEVYTGDATIVVFAEKPELAAAAAKRLTGIHGSRAISQTETLPAPAAGALAGKLTC